jgi:hypothetical protein
MSLMLKGIGHMHSQKRFRRMKRRLILISLATLVAVALPGLAEARGGHDEGGLRHGSWHHRGSGGTTALGRGYGRGPNSRIGSWKRLGSTIGNPSLSALGPDAPINLFLLIHRSGGP